MNFRSFNLNLLIIFETMMAARSTTKTGELLGLSQSAVSNSLAQLRNLLNDTLFVRMRNEMVPTPRAMELIGPISEALAQVQKAVAPVDAYNAADSKRTFRIGMTDYTAFVILAGILSGVRNGGRGIKICVQNINASQIHSTIDNDEVDICVGFSGETNENHIVELLFRDDWVCARRATEHKAFTMKD